MTMQERAPCSRRCCSRVRWHKQATRPDGHGADDGRQHADDPTSGGGDMVPPREDGRDPARPRAQASTIVSRCLAIAVDNGTLPQERARQDHARDPDLAPAARPSVKVVKTDARGEDARRLRDQARQGDRVPDAAEAVRDVVHVRVRGELRSAMQCSRCCAGGVRWIASRLRHRRRSPSRPSRSP